MSTSTTTIPEESKSVFGNLARQFQANIQTYTLIIAMVVIWGIFTFMTNGLFLAPQNFSNLFRQMTVTALLSAGMVLVIVVGSIDLSVGKLAGFVSVVVAAFQVRVWAEILPGQEVLGTILSITVGLLTGVIFGMIQGYIIAYMRVTSFIVTLAGQWILNGLILLVTQGKTIPANQPTLSIVAQRYFPIWVGWVIAAVVVAFLFYNMFTGRRRKASYGFTLAPFYQDLAKTTFFSLLVIGYMAMVNEYHGFQIPVAILAVVAVVMAYVAANTRFGRYAYAIGGNREAARLSGINIKNQVFTIFVLMGLLCGVSGVTLASYVGYGTIAAGGGYELDAIAACILGGTSTLGGEGTIFGAMVGALIMASLTTGLQMMNTPAALQYVVKGAILIVAVTIDVYFKKNR
jgi:D-xylose transport system permease protein